jgi:biopolymer transport protein ExbD
LSEINITPLLDLAFVLLIIFIITTPLLDKGLELNLPKAVGQPDRRNNQDDIRTVEITSQGYYAMNRRYMRLDEIINYLAQEYRANPRLVVYIRADEDSRVKSLVALTDGCVQNGISRYSLRTEPIGNR